MPNAVTDILETVLLLSNEDGYRRGLQGAASDVLTFGQANTRAATLMGAIGGAAPAVAAGIGFYGRALNEATGDQVAFQRAAGNFKNALSPGQIADFTSELQGLTGVADDAIADALGLLGTFQVSAPDAQALALPILNATEALKAQGATASGIAVQVGKSLQTGDSGALRRSGIILDEVRFKAASAAERVNILRDALQSQGGDAALADNPARNLEKLRRSIEDLEGAVGAGLVGPLDTVTKLATGAVQAFNGMPDPIKQVGTAAIFLGGTALAAIWGGLQANNIMMGTNIKKLVDLQAGQQNAGTSARNHTVEILREADAHRIAAFWAGEHARAEGRAPGGAGGSGAGARVGSSRTGPGAAPWAAVGATAVAAGATAAVAMKKPGSATTVPAGANAPTTQAAVGKKPGLGADAIGQGFSIYAIGQTAAAIGSWVRDQLPQEGIVRQAVNLGDTINGILPGGMAANQMMGRGWDYGFKNIARGDPFDNRGIAAARAEREKAGVPGLPADPQAQQMAKMQEVIDELRAQTEILTGVRSAVNTGDIPGARQMMLQGLAKALS